MRNEPQGENESNAAFAEVFSRLAGHYGPLHWWPAETPFEVVIGAILTQNTAWRNVERAIAHLRAAGVLTPAAIRDLPRHELELLIRPAGFFRQKAERLQLFISHLLANYGGDLAAMLAGDLETARRQLLARKGIGPETADSILLYAGGRPSFVVDAYTRRIFSRLGLLAGREPYETIRALFMDNLPADPEFFNEYHALIVEHAKTLCRKSPLCSPCPLLALCPAGQKNMHGLHLQAVAPNRIS